MFNLIFGTNYNFHRIYTHSLFYAIAFFFIAMLFLFSRKEEYKIFKWNPPKPAFVMLFLAMAFGWLMHIALDCALAGDGYLNLIPTIPLNFCPS
ncbi:MAG: metal-dependent hydrolase, partial [Deltaproteobacteria bacterium]|nr:metal-dependent hydrolase [Deltaproteobacteria bacterium]